MKSRRGDLARLLTQLPPDQREIGAELLGFERQRREQQPEGEALPPQESVQDAREFDFPPRSKELTTPLWRMESYEPRGDVEAESKPEPPTEGMTERDLHDPSRSLLYHPPSPLLATWSQLEAPLKAALSCHRRGNAPDVEALVGSLSRGEVLKEIPRLTRRSWPESLTIWGDRSERLVTLAEDQAMVIRGLVGRMGVSHLRLRFLDEGSQRYDRARCGHLLGEALPPRGGVVLVLGDLGACGDPKMAECWGRTGALLKRRGVHPVALVPVGRSRLPEVLLRHWTIVPWGVRGAGLPKDGQRTQRLLRLISPAGLVQPGLLRSLRQLLPPGEADAGTEFDAQSHEDVLSADASGLVLTGEAQTRLRDAFAREAPEALQVAVRDEITRWYRHLPESLIHTASVQWHLRAPLRGKKAKEEVDVEAEGEGQDPVQESFDVPPPGDLQAARGYFKRLEATLVSGAGPGGSKVWEHFARVALDGIPEDCFAQPKDGQNPDPFRQTLANIWAHAHRNQDNVVIPKGVSKSTLRSTPAPEPTRTWALRQVGGKLVLTPAPERPDPAVEAPRPGSPLGVIRAKGRIWVRDAGGKRLQHQLGDSLTLELAPGQGLRIESDIEGVRIAAWHPALWEDEAEPWAKAAGRDQYGLWADSDIKGVTQRFRWIPPGRFLMGSPEDEPGRFDREGPQHVVILTQGYWLGDTPVTQSLWEAVMGENPSQFKSPTRPVERVSWKECKGFMKKARQEALGPAFRFPSEAEWEHACRAGTTGSTWRGPLEIIGERNAPGLDDIAWYGGNSGRDFDLDVGVDSKSWREKHHEHEKAGTRAVKMKQGNPWGLYDILGNVHEWCEDKNEPYAPELRTNPVVTSGPRRVIRGGSWRYDARGVRAAYRNWYEPDYRYGFLGFRLARGPRGPEALNKKRGGRRP